MTQVFSLAKRIFHYFRKTQNLFEVHRMLIGIDKKLIQNVEFFDEYNSSEIGNDFKSITLKLPYSLMKKLLPKKI